jgi:predicted TIM-barrel fold metal-dependent hydrolase
MTKSRNKIGRREFLGNGAKLAVAASALAMAGKDTKAEAAKSTYSLSKKPKFIIDAHYHCRGTKEWVEETVKIYRAHNAMACVFTRMRDLELIKGAIASYPDVFIGYGYVKLDDPNTVREIETFKKNGFVGMKFHRPRRNYDDPSYFQAYRLCEQYGMHMIFHTGIVAHRNFDKPQWTSSARMRPIYLDTLCRMFPRTTIQGAHFGNPWYDEAAEACRWNPHLYFDITGSTLHKFIKLGHLKKMREFLWWSADESEKTAHTYKGGSDAWEHIVFATDERPTGLVPNIERFQKMLDANNVPEATREKMWGLTMARVLGINPKTHKFIKKSS